MCPQCALQNKHKEMSCTAIKKKKVTQSYRKLFNEMKRSFKNALPRQEITRQKAAKPKVRNAALTVRIFFC